MIFEHQTTESLIRELSRDGQLRFMCGFKSNKDVPKSYMFSRFFNKLFKKEEIVNDIFDKLVDELEAILPGFGRNLAIDGKAMSSLARRENKKLDGRRDLDANQGRK